MIEKKVWTLLPGADPTPRDSETQRDYAVRAFGFNGVRGRLPKEITEAFLAATGEVRNKPKPVPAPTGRKRGRPRKNPVEALVASSQGIRGSNAQEGETVRAPGIGGGKAARWKKGDLINKTDEEVITLVKGRKLSWTNEVAEGLGYTQVETARLGGHVKVVVTKRGRRCLEFVPYDGQFAEASLRVIGLDRL